MYLHISHRLKTNSNNPLPRQLSVTSIAILKHNDWVVNIQTSSSIRYAVRFLSKTQ